MKHFDFTGKSRCRDLRTNLREGILPTVIQFVILVFVILEFAVIIGSGNGLPPIQEVRIVGGEETNPNIVRLCYALGAFIAAIVCAAAASRMEGKGKSTTAVFWVGLIGGLLLWQSVGECAWHFGIPCEDFLVGLPRIESAASTMLIILVTLLIIYGYKHSSFDFGMWVFILSFYNNWLGHFLQIGTFPWVSAFFEEKTWFLYSGLATGIPGVILAIYCMFFAAKDKKARLVSSILLYLALGLIMTGIRGE